jgi:pimeloyl-ACP methyl ester carboxylesterase
MKRFLILLALVVTACADSNDNKPAPTPKQTPGRYRSEGGEFPVGAIPIGSLHDAQRNKDIGLVIEYPSQGQGPFPVIVFSHGYGASNRNYVGLTEYWAGHGYVCIKPAHADAGKLRELLRERRQSGKTIGEEIWESQSVADWRDRVRDVTFILDSFDALEERYPELKGKMDRNRIAIGGHSYGAFVAMLLAGVEPVRDGKPLQLRDERVKAIIAMSPQGVSATRGLSAESFRNVKIPAMFMTGSEDRGALESETPEWRRTAFDNAPAGDKYFVLINGANHLSFGGGYTLPNPTDDSLDRMDEMNPQRNPERAAPRTRSENRFILQRGIFDSIKIGATAFWDTYLKSAPEAREYLDTKLGARGGVTVVKK